MSGVAQVAELADAHASGACGLHPWRFESSLGQFVSVRECFAVVVREGATMALDITEQDWRVMRPFVRNIRAFRKAKGLRQQDLADKAGLERQSICLIESEKQMSLICHFVRIADALEVSLDELRTAKLKAKRKSKRKPNVTAKRKSKQ